MSQKYLGIKSKVDPSVASTRINQYVTGRHEPSYVVVATMAGVVGVPPAFFYTFDDDLAALIEAYPHFSRKARSNLNKLAKQTLLEGAKKRSPQNKKANS